jgi:heme-degrading monooxygenase HmoA
VYATLTTTKGATEDGVELATMAGEAMVGWLRELEGFQGLLLLNNPDTGITQVLSLWESREVAERHAAARLRLRDLVTATVDVQVQATVSYEVAFAELPAP